MSATFYADLIPHTSFVDIADPSAYSPIPDDWTILASDVRASTAAIEAGRYKEVNTVGASTIIAVLNAATSVEPPLDIPFVFGGDGATLVVPPALLESSKAALAATKEIARSAFELDLRISAIPVRRIREAGFDVSVARFHMSENYDQAMFRGGGLAYADKLLKDSTVGAEFEIDESGVVADADFTGLECRWEDIPSQYGEASTLIVKATTGAASSDDDVYRELLSEIDVIYAGNAQPVQVESMTLITDPRKVGRELPFRTVRNAFAETIYKYKVVAQAMMFGLMRRFGIKIKGVKIDEFLEHVVAATDHRKFDDSLRMVLSGTPAQRQKLTAYLEQKSDSDDLIYGIHLSDRVLMTCVVFERIGPQVHFIDGADGGYALAAKELKSKMLV